MNRQKFFKIICMVASLSGSHLYSNQNKTVSVGLNFDAEEYGILDTLQPLIAGGIDTFFLLDTGAAPTTLSMAVTYLHEKNIRPTIISASTDDCIEWRKQIIFFVQKNNPEIPFLLLPTLGWRLQNVSALLTFCQHELCTSCPIYYLRLVRDTCTESYEPCLVRCSQAAADEKIRIKIPDTIYGEIQSVHYGIVPCKDRLLREQNMLLKQYASDPHDVEIMFKLASLYAALGDQDQAMYFYTQCAHTQQPCEEKFLALYKLGCMIEQCESKNTQDCWSVAQHYYVQACATSPHRAEPLVKLAQHYAAVGNLKLAYFFARRAAQLPYPHDAVLTVEKEVYDYTRFDLLGQYAWYVGEFEIGEWALRKGLAVRPDNDHLKRNVQFYLDRRESKDRCLQNNGVDFIESMSFGAGFNKDFLLTDPCAKKIRELYERHWMPALEKSNIVRIPKIIHQIWMGSDLPVRCQALQATWRKHHPDWEYRLWNESDIEQLGLFNKKAFDAALTWGEKSDIARYEILYRFGGLYSDTDFECVRSFDPLHRCLDFYAGLENGECLVGNALIGSAPGHPILKSCIETLQSAKQGESGWQHVCNRTGPGHVTRCVKEHVMQEESDIGHCVLMPTGYFFPWYPYFGQVRTMQQALNSLRPETFAVHHWHSSWVK